MTGEPVLGAFLIGLREGLEAALVVGILVSYLTKLGRRDVLPRLWLGIGLAIALAVGVGALLTFGAYALTTQAQEIIGGALSLMAVGLVTWMIFWMQKAARTLKRTLEGELDKALALGSLWGIVIVGFVSVAREGIETALLLWSMVESAGAAPQALAGALLGLGISVCLGWLIARGMVRLNLGMFFSWTGGLLIVVAAGVLAYGVHDLQEAGVLPGPFGPLATLDPATGAVGIGAAGFPFGYAFDVSHVIAPGGTLATLLQASVGFMPAMTWMQVLGWALYLAVIGGLFLSRVQRRPRPVAQPSPSLAQGAS